ncbi:hypothetical protein F4810DRAFT_553368 [Camillea tinctor]|nr:hypothetical protein F4810DRAFT_553368 [Camillea tinctor]
MSGVRSGQPLAPSSSSSNVLKSKNHHKGAPKAQKSSKGYDNMPADFWFVVNELMLDEEKPLQPDQWGNIVPPIYPNYYIGERIGRVFRYQNGTVTEAEGFEWCRPQWGGPGSISYPARDESGNLVFYSLTTYSSSTVFDLGPFCPCAYAMADATATDMNMLAAPYDRFYALQFDNRDGTSRAFFNGGAKYIAGAANWLGRLVSSAYRHPGTQESLVPTALGGEIGTILGLMALAERQGRTDHAFLSHWNGSKWQGIRQHYVSPHGPPRVVLVSVAVDSSQNPGHEFDSIRNFENYGYAVLG